MQYLTSVCNSVTSVHTRVLNYYLGIRWLSEGCFVTVSTDQRLNIWLLHQEIALHTSCVIHVADASALELIRYTIYAVCLLLSYMLLFTEALQSIVL